MLLSAKGGGLAQLGEREAGSLEVGGSIPPRSTISRFLSEIHPQAGSRHLRPECVRTPTSVAPVALGPLAVLGWPVAAIVMALVGLSRKGNK